MASAMGGLDAPTELADFPSASSSAAHVGDAAGSVQSEHHQPEFYSLSGEECTERAGMHEQQYVEEAIDDVESWENETQQISQIGAVREHVDASSSEVSNFWSSALKLSQRAGKLVDKARSAVADEAQRCVDDVRGIVQDTRLIGERMTMAGEALSATVAASGAATDERSQTLGALESIKQGLAVTAEVSWDIVRDVDETQRELIGAIQQGMEEIRSEWTEPAPIDGHGSVRTATATRWTDDIADCPVVETIGRQVGDQANDTSSRICVNNLNHVARFADVEGCNDTEVGEAQPASRQQAAPRGVAAISMRSVTTASRTLEEESIFIIGSDDEDGFFDETPALERGAGEVTDDLPGAAPTRDEFVVVQAIDTKSW